MTKLIPTIGVEVHAELKTKSKVFSNSLNSYGEIANTKTNVVDLGYPGTLPRLNKEVIDLALRACTVTHCRISSSMYFDRKNYFYPDLPKGYQITQSDTPIGRDGYIEIEINGVKKKIGIERIHIEEDTSKSVHEGESTLLDFNRAGIPLIEIVTKPVIESAEEAVLYLEKLRELLLYSEVSDVKIEEGSMRCDANVSLREEGSTILGTKTEVKNIGSISSVKLAINYEIERQKQMIENNEAIKEQTRRYDEKKAATVLMRTKESNTDYRYFPEPDIPYVHIDNDWIEAIKNEMPMMPDDLRNMYKEMGINEIAIKALIARKDLSSFFKNVSNMGANNIISANLLTGDVLSHLNKHNITLDKTKIETNSFAQLVNMLNSNEISSKMGKEILMDLIMNGGTVKEIIESKGLKQINDEDSLVSLINIVLDNNLNVVDDFKNGNERAVKYLIGQVMKESKGQANPMTLNDLLTKELSKR
jgi:aspartyl-tRNA(Asn)/glutamyl-tRNA(Gln) amidotransferase subunit B